MAVFEEWIINFLSPNTITGLLLTVQLMLVVIIGYLFLSIKVISKSISESKETTEIQIKEIRETISRHNEQISEIKTLVEKVDTTISHFNKNLEKQDERTENIMKMLFDLNGKT
jgi:methyl-accepting chemotaxis protein